MPPRSHGQTDPPRCQRTYKMPVRKDGGVTPMASHAGNHPVDADSNISRRFATGTAIQENVPARPIISYGVTGPAFVIAIIPLDEIAVDYRVAAEPGGIARLVCAPKRAGQDQRLSMGAEIWGQSLGLTQSSIRQRQIAQPGVTFSSRPRCFTVTHDMQQR